jgi:hypothetical protein
LKTQSAAQNTVQAFLSRAIHLFKLLNVISLLKLLNVIALFNLLNVISLFKLLYVNALFKLLNVITFYDNINPENFTQKEITIKVAGLVDGFVITIRYESSVDLRDESRGTQIPDTSPANLNNNIYFNLL